MKRLAAIGKSDGHGCKVRVVLGCPLWVELRSLFSPGERLFSRKQTLKSALQASRIG